MNNYKFNFLIYNFDKISYRNLYLILVLIFIKRIFDIYISINYNYVLYRIPFFWKIYLNMM